MSLSREEKAVLDLMVEGRGMRAVLDALAELCEKHCGDETIMLWDKDHYVDLGDLETVAGNLRADMF